MGMSGVRGNQQESWTFTTKGKKGKWCKKGRGIDSGPSCYLYSPECVGGCSPKFATHLQSRATAKIDHRGDALEQV